MITTYYIEKMSDKTIMGYFTKLGDAKKDLQIMDYSNPHFRTNQYQIVCLKGQNFGEGFHQYKISYVGHCFIKEKLR